MRTDNREELEKALEGRIRFFFEILPKATAPTEWGEDNCPDWVRLLLALSSPTAFPDGWTPRQGAQLTLKQIARDLTAIGRTLLLFGDKRV